MEILICTHDQMLIKELSNPLKDSGYPVTTAGHAAQAIQFMLHRYFSAVIIDPCIMGMSVKEALPVIRRVSPHTKIIVTGEAPLGPDVWTVSRPSALDEIRCILNNHTKECV